MRNKRDFESLENWADRNLRKVGPVSAPPNFLDGVMKKVHAPCSESPVLEKPSVFIFTLRFLVVIASLALITVGLFWDPQWLQSWWSETSAGMTLNLMGQLFVSFKQLAVSLLGLVPSMVWIGLGVSIVFAYLIAAIVGSVFVHFTFRRNRLQSL